MDLYVNNEANKYKYPVILEIDNSFIKGANVSKFKEKKNRQTKKYCIFCILFLFCIYLFY